MDTVLTLFKNGPCHRRRCSGCHDIGGGSPAWAEAPQTAQAVVDESDDSGDPLEPINRFLFGVNEIFQMVILGPATGMYQHLVPPPVREAISHMIDNLKTPVILANDLLQGEGERAWVTTQRFVVNTTLGVGGIMDPATKMGLARHNEDFGQTLAVWRGRGLLPVVAILCPSSPRMPSQAYRSTTVIRSACISRIPTGGATYARMSVGGRRNTAA